MYFISRTLSLSTKHTYMCDSKGRVISRLSNVCQCVHLPSFNFIFIFNFNFFPEHFSFQRVGNQQANTIHQLSYINKNNLINKFVVCCYLLTSHIVSLLSSSSSSSSLCSKLKIEIVNIPGEMDFFSASIA